MSDTSANNVSGSRSWASLLCMLLALVVVACLGVGAIALERPTGQVAGRVLSEESGKGLAGVKVTFSGPVTRSLLTRPDGSYRFFHLPVGSYSASANGRRRDPQWQQSETAVAEGKMVDHVDFKLSRTNPSLEVSHTQRVFTPSQEVKIAFAGTGLDALEVSLYRLDLPKAASSDPELRAVRYAAVADLNARGLIHRLSGWQQAITAENREDNDRFYKTIQVPKLPVGAYILAVDGDAIPFTDEPPLAKSKAPIHLAKAYWFNVSRLGLMTKRSGSELLAWGVDLETKQTVRDMGLTLIVEPSRKESRRPFSFQKGRSDGQGLARFTLPAGTEALAVLAEHLGSYALTQGSFYNAERDHRIFAYTDRPVYRPGQKVFFKGIVRAEQVGNLAGAGRSEIYVSAAGNMASIKVKDATNAVVFEKTLPISAHSAFDGEFALGEEAPLGEYNAEVTVGLTSSGLNFKVADYRKPEYKVEITPGKARYTLGDTAEVQLLASYYFGAPVPNAKLEVTVYAAPLYGYRDPAASYFSGFTSEPGIEPVWGFGDVVQQTTAVTDAQGRYTLNVDVPGATDDPENWQGDRVLTVSVEAMDASGRPVKATQGFAATQGTFRVAVATDESLYTAGKGMRLTLETQDYDEKPVSAEVAIAIQRLESTSKVSPEGDEYTETKRVTAFQGNARTDATGRAVLEVPDLGEGSYEVRANANDSAGHIIRDTAYAWIAGADASASTFRYSALQLLLDKKVYHVGDKARMLVVSPVPNVPVLVTIEGTRLHEARVINVKGTSGVIEWPVSVAYKPNVYVSASVINGKEFLQAEKSLNVLPDDKFLQVKVTADKSRLEPGEQVTYTVETRDNRGRPVPAEVTLAVVDQAIYAIEPDQTPDIRGYFHGPRYNDVSTLYSFAEDYSGGLDKFAPDPRVRARFEDTAAWFPALQTGADGRTSVTVTLPDNLTTWVASARAATADTKVGTGSLNVVATKDLLVRLETPRFVVMGDRLTISAIAHSYLTTPQTVDVTLEVTGFELAAPPTQHLVLQPGDAKRAAWEVKVPGPANEGDLARAFLARVIARPQAPAGGGRPANGDAMELPIPALPYGSEVVEVLAGTATVDAPGSATFTLPADHLPTTASLAVDLHLSPMAAIQGAITYLHQYPYGCVEQTMSRFLPDVALQRRLAIAGVPTATLFPDRERRLADGVRRLVSFQHGDGGWGWWEHDESQIELTSYVLYGLAEARRADVAVPTDVPRRGIEFLKRNLPKIERDLFTRNTAVRNAGADARAFALFSLAGWSAAPPKEVDRLYADRGALTAYGRAQFALALAELGDSRREEVLRLVVGDVQETELHAYWEDGAADYCWQDSRVEATAYALRAILAIAPRSPLVPKVVRWLESKNARGYWESTKDTAAAAIALADTLAIRRPPPPSGLTAHFFLNDREVAIYTPSPAGETPATFRFGGSDLKTGVNTLRVALGGAASGEVDFSGGLRYLADAGRLAPTGSHGLTIERSYYLLPADVYAKAKGEGRGVATYFSDEQVGELKKLSGQVKAGERILVRVTVGTQHTLRYVALEDPLPAGCEILEDQPDNWGYWWDHQEYHDEKAAFFVTHLPAGTKTLYYVMRPTTPGHFRVLPPTAWGMYAPEVRARGASAELTIQE